MIKYDRFAPIQRSRINFSNTADKRVYEMQVIDIYEKKKKKKRRNSRCLSCAKLRSFITNII